MRATLSLRTIFSALAFCASFLAHAGAPPVVISDRAPIQPQFEYLEDQNGVASVEDIANRPDSQWQQAPEGNATLGITSSAYWLRFSVDNRTGHRLDLIAELDYSQLDDVTFYVYSGNRPQKKVQTGDAFPFYPREIDHPSMTLRFGLSPDQTKTIYVRVETAGSIILPLQIWREDNFFSAA